MSPAAATDQLTQVMLLVLYLSMPTIIVASLVGLLVSLIQALTQIQEQTLPFAVKLVAVAITLAATAAFTGSEMVAYTNSVVDKIPRLVSRS
jgi:type III secretion protein S